MKNISFVYPWLLLIFFVPLSMSGQDKAANNFFSSDSVPALYLGIDFTKAKLINDEKSDPVIIQGQQFPGINRLIIDEPKKYDIQEAYHRIFWGISLDAVNLRNQKISPDSLKSTNDNDLLRLNRTDIENLVAGFDFGNHTGYGVLLIVEGMDKTKKMITIWYTLVDMGSKKIIVTERVPGKLGSGFGFRNYWASAIKNTIGNVKSDIYDQWKKNTGIK
jgi:hypothetical protein